MIKKEEVLWILLQLIPPGKVISYGELAKVLNLHPRIVGRLLHKNEKLVVIPCHRVVRSDGSLGGYVLGTDFKRRLLLLEGVEFCNEDKICSSSFFSLSKFLKVESS